MSCLPSPSRLTPLFVQLFFFSCEFSPWNAGRGGDYETLSKNGRRAGAKKMILGLSRIVLFFCLVLFSLLSHSCFFFPRFVRLVPDRFSQLVVSLMPSAPATGCLRGCCKTGDDRTCNQARAVFTPSFLSPVMDGVWMSWQSGSGTKISPKTFFNLPADDGGHKAVLLKLLGSLE